MHETCLQDILRLDAALHTAVNDGAWQDADVLAGERQACIARLFAEIDPSELEGFREHFEQLLQRDRQALEKANAARKHMHGDNTRLREQFSAANQYLKVAHLDV